jgi:hypothetical protein
MSANDKVDLKPLFAESSARLAAIRARKKAGAKEILASGVVVPFPLALTWERLANAREKGSLEAGCWQTLRQVAAEGKEHVR